MLDRFEDSVKALEENVAHQFELIQHWLKAYIAQADQHDKAEFVAEVATLLLTDSYSPLQVVHTVLNEGIQGMQGAHQQVQGQQYQLHYHRFCAVSATIPRAWPRLSRNSRSSKRT